MLSLIPGHDYFKPRKSNPIAYREMLSAHRNLIAHGRHISTTKEAEFVANFIQKWRDEVINLILNKYKLKFDQDWSLLSL